MPEVTIIVDFPFGVELKNTNKLKVDNDIADCIIKAAQCGDDIIEVRNLGNETFKSKYTQDYCNSDRGTEKWMLEKTDEALNTVGRTIIYAGEFGCMELANILRSINQQHTRICGKGIERVKLHGVLNHNSLISNVVISRAALPNTEIVINRKTCVCEDAVIYETVLEILKSKTVQII